jgi:hypothetical protein
MVSLGTCKIIWGTLAYLATGPVIVGHSVILWAVLGLELELLALCSGSARPASTSALSPASVPRCWSPWHAWHLVWSAWSSAWQLLTCSGWSHTFAGLPSVVVINVGTGIFNVGTLTYLATGPVVVGHSVMVWVWLELELMLLALHWGSAWSGTWHWGSAWSPGFLAWQLVCSAWRGFMYLFISHCFPLLWLSLGL